MRYFRTAAFRRAYRSLDETRQTRADDSLLALAAQADPVLAELWDNAKDAAYDRL